MFLRTILFILQWVLGAVGIIGNIWVIVAIVRYNAMKKTTNKIMFINLAAADLGVLIVRNPFYFLSHYLNNRWPFGSFLCKIVLPVSLMFLPASLLTLVAISFSRCRAVVYVKRLKEMSVRAAWCTVAFIWAFVILYYPVVELPLRRVNETSQLCYVDVSRPVEYILFGFEDFFFVLCFFVIIRLFIRMRRALLGFSEVYNDMAVVKRMMKNIKALQLLWPVVIALFITMIPMMIGRAWFWITAGKHLPPSLFLQVVDVLLVTNSAINPFIYFIVSTEFRQRIVQIDCVQRCVRFLWKERKPRRSTDEMLCPDGSNDVQETKL